MFSMLAANTTPKRPPTADPVTPINEPHIINILKTDPLDIPIVRNIAMLLIYP